MVMMVTLSLPARHAARSPRVTPPAARASRRPASCMDSMVESMSWGTPQRGVLARQERGEDGGRMGERGRWRRADRQTDRQTERPLSDLGLGVTKTESVRLTRLGPRGVDLGLSLGGGI